MPNIIIIWSIMSEGHRNGGGPAGFSAVITRDCGIQTTEKDIVKMSNAEEEKRRGEAIRRALEATSTIADLEALPLLPWPEMVFQRTALKVINPISDPAAEAVAMLLTKEDRENPMGLFLQTRDRHPEIFEEEGADALTIMDTTTTVCRNGRETKKGRWIMGIPIDGGSTPSLVHATREAVNSATAAGISKITIPKPTGVGVEEYRRICEFVIKETTILIEIAIPRKRTNTKQRKTWETEAILLPARNFTAKVEEVREILMDPSHQVAIKRVRRAREGGVLIEVEKGQNIESLTKSLRTKTDGTRVLGHRRDEATYQVTDLDTGATVEEIRKGVIAQGIPPEAVIDVPVKTMRQERNGTKTARIVINGALAPKMTGIKYIRVGPVKCPVRRWLDIVRCFKCWGFGHKSLKCDGSDRSGLCVNCAEPDHKADECQITPKCVLCNEKGHKTGAGTCPFMKEAKEKAKDALDSQ